MVEARGRSPRVENAPLGFFANLTVAPGVNLAYAGADNSFGAGISNDGLEQGGALGFNVTPGGSRFLRIVPVFGNPGAPVTATFAFDAPVTAFGAYLTGTETPIDGRISLRFNDGSAQQINVTKTDPSGVLFVGFVSTVAISSVPIQEDGPFGTRDLFGVDDVYYRSSAVAVPEPSSLALAGVGLVGAVVMRARRRKGGVV